MSHLSRTFLVTLVFILSLPTLTWAEAKAIPYDTVTVRMRDGIQTTNLHLPYWYALLTTSEGSDRPRLVLLLLAIASWYRTVEVDLNHKELLSPTTMRGRMDMTPLNGYNTNPGVTAGLRCGEVHM